MQPSALQHLSRLTFSAVAEMVVPKIKWLTSAFRCARMQRFEQRYCIHPAIPTLADAPRLEHRQASAMLVVLFRASGMDGKYALYLE